ncbi:MAG: AAA family ATPase, partial [Fuerstiella sp.]
MSLEEQYKAVRAELEKVIFGQDDVLEFSLAAVFSCGHLLLEGPPGVAKTLLVRTIATALDLDFKRVQMTPDLLPNDITGSSIYRDDTRT